MFSLAEAVRQGGAMMYPLLFCSVIALAIAMERAVAFRKLAAAPPDRLLARIRERVGALDAAAALGELEGRDSPFARVFARGLRNADRGAEAIDLTMGQEAAREAALLERFLPGLRTIVTIAPLLGLLGTIAGMMSSFKAVAARSAMASPTEVMGGVSESLVATATGIVVAVFGLLVYNYFSVLVKRFIEDAEFYGSELTNLLTGRAL